MSSIISVVMSAYNAEHYLKEAIDSILDQTFADFEFIIVDDGSDDNSAQIINSYTDPRIIKLKQNRLGLPAALNWAIKNSSSSIIARMDADDISYPYRLYKQYHYLLENPNYIAIGSNAEIIDMHGVPIFTSQMPITDLEIRNRLPITPFIHPSAMFRKEPFMRAGGYCNKMIKAQDVVLFNRMKTYGKFFNIETPLLKYRIVPTANSAREKKQEKKLNTIILKCINENDISDADELFLKSITNNKYDASRTSNYHLYIAKKFIWNNYQPNQARAHLKKSIKSKINVLAPLYFLLSYVPKSFITPIYKIIK
jgi:glycosyltransferase involved in cell wall biosynthesis